MSQPTFPLPILLLYLLIYLFTYLLVYLFTCVSIDNVIEKLEKLVEHKKQLNKKQLKELVNRLEKLRSANESLRESGVYWYEKLKHLLYDKK